MKERRKLLLLVFVISIVFASFFAFSFEHPVTGDAVRYDRIAWNIASNGSFSLSDKPPYSPTMFIEPMYPFSLSVIYKFFGHNYLPMRIFQIILFGITSILVYLLSEQIFSNQKMAALTAIITALCPTLANYPSYLLSETVFTFLLCLTILILIRAFKTRKILLFFFSGILLGITSLCKGVTLFFFLFVLLGLILLRKRFDYSIQMITSHFLIFCLGFFALISPWIYRNHRLFGYNNIGLRGELALWMRANKLDDTLEDTKHALVYNFSEFLGKLLFPKAALNPSDFILEDSREAYKRQQELLKLNYDFKEANEIIRNEALEKIKRRPLKYLVQTFLELEKMAAFIYVPTLNETQFINNFYRLKNGKFFLSSIRGIFRISAYLIIIFAIIGLWFSRGQWYNWYIPLAIIIYINLIYSLLYGLGRYGVPLIPFYLIFANLGFVSFVEKLKGRHPYNL